MARTGRPPKPTRLKLLAGTARPGRMRNEPQPEIKAPRCPGWLAPAAKSEWKRLAKTLVRLGVLTELDRGVFSSYCQSWAKWQEAERAIQKHGLVIRTKTGYVMQSPVVSIAKQERKAMLEAGSELGLSPAARTRLDVKIPAGEKTPMELLIEADG